MASRPACAYASDTHRHEVPARLVGQDAFQSLSSNVAHPRHDVGISVHRLRDSGVSQHFGNDFGVHVLREQQGRASVPQGVEGESGEPRLWSSP
jgi:hypothetical protein